MADAPVLALMAQRAYQASFAAILDTDALRRADAAFFAERFLRALDQLTLAEVAAEPAGFALVTGETLAMLFVDAAHMRGGVGSALLHAAETRGARRLETFAANAATRRFYERRGWTLSLLYRRPFLGHAYAFASYVWPNGWEGER